MLKEGQETEFKREYTDAIKRTIVAFANTNGGDLYIGIENDGTVYGVDDSDAMMVRVSNMIHDAISPDVSFISRCDCISMDNKTVIKVTVQRGADRPYYLTGKGIRPEGVYIRHGATTIPASESAILNMIKESSGQSYESAGSLNQGLTFDSTETYFRTKQLDLDIAKMRSLGLIEGDGTYTNLGMLLSDQCIHTIKIAVFQGKNKEVFRDRQEFTGSLFQQMQQAIEYIERFNLLHAEIVGLERIERYDYPKAAIREALFNAVVHRDYAFHSSVLISIFDDRIEFVNVGGLMRGISFDDIMLGVSSLRNPKLANVFYRLKLIEAYGTGIMKIQDCYAGVAVTAKFETSSNAFKVTLPNLNASAETLPKKKERTSVFYTIEDQREYAVMELIDQNGYTVRSQVQEKLDISQTTAGLVLREMVDKGVICKSGGGGKRTQYIKTK